MIDADNVKQRFPEWVLARKVATTTVTKQPIRFFEADDIVTTDGVIRVQPGDYFIALDSQGNPYPIEVGVFEETYERVAA